MVGGDHDFGAVFVIEDEGVGLLFQDVILLLLVRDDQVVLDVLLLLVAVNGGERVQSLIAEFHDAFTG